MNWQIFSQIRFYASVGVALVGLSAASTLITVPTLAQDPPDVEVKVDTVEVAGEQVSGREIKQIATKMAELQTEIAKLKRTVGKNHPSVANLQEEVEDLKAMAEDYAARSRIHAARQADAARQVEATRRAVTIAKAQAKGDGKIEEVELADVGDVITDNIVGTTSRVIVRQGEDGNMLREVVNVPAEGALATVYRVAGKENKEFQKAVEKLKSKDSSEAEKKAAKDQIEETLSKQFDEDMTQREKQIVELEKQLSSLKEQLEKRRDAKQRLMELRMELLINESEGLGFPNAWQSNSRYGLTTTGPMAVPGMKWLPSVRSLPGTLIPPVPPTPAIAPAAPVPPVAPAAPVAPAVPALPAE